ncbi:hypothetical protein Droror1_Dr00018212, partial [Drosera rotundifolia]
EAVRGIGAAHGCCSSRVLFFVGFYHSWMGLGSSLLWWLLDPCTEKLLQVQYGGCSEDCICSCGYDIETGQGYSIELMKVDMMSNSGFKQPRSGTRR